MRRSLLVIGSAIGALLAPVSASAATFVVDALANSSTGGTGLSTGLIVATGQALQVSADANDLWSSGALPRWSNADGQISQLIATGTDESGQPAGTIIGQVGPIHWPDTFGAPIGALVGEIGGVYALLGTSYNGTAWADGELKLYFWDSFAGDNSGTITVAAAIPEPATWALMMAGFGILGFGLRRRSSAATRVSFNFA